MKLLAVAAFLLCGVAVFAADAGEVEQGLAAAYPADVGIERDPAVLFHDDFEQGKPGEKWDWPRGVEFAEPEADPKIARGARSVRFVVKDGRNQDVTFWKRLTPGRDEVFMRVYVRYGPDFGYLQHGGSAFCASTRESFGPGGHAGRAPRGDTLFWATIEPIGRRGTIRPPGAFMFYAYWWKMKADGRGRYWGNLFQPEPVQVPDLEKWSCVEWRVKTNTPAKDDGELDCWVDGRKCGEFRGINWRETENLKVNQVQISLYVATGKFAGSPHPDDNTRTIWYDDVVVATKYIGPQAPVASVPDK